MEEFKRKRKCELIINLEQEKQKGIYGGNGSSCLLSQSFFEQISPHGHVPSQVGHNQYCGSVKHWSKW